MQHRLFFEISRLDDESSMLARRSIERTVDYIGRIVFAEREIGVHLRIWAHAGFALGLAR
jgi:hypothetical protein